jgi:ribosomal protein L7Ae-like RNA K-turn-binding protein
MLSKLAGFQAAAKAKDPLKAKSRLRFVTGLRQCHVSARAGMCKLLLLAPDTEASAALDGKLALLIQDAKEKGVPTLYCLSRRQMGKACQTNTRQSCVSVYDAQGPGAMEVYKKCIAVTERHVAPPHAVEALRKLMNSGEKEV